MVLTTTPCLTTHNNEVNRKRKRARKSVRFDVDQNVIIDTYSPMDYDRGSVFSFPPVMYKINPIVLAQNNEKQQPSLSLEIPSSPCDSEDSSPETEESCHIPSIISNTTFNNKKKKPKLSVDTSICGGPLFFTKLSTNHVRHKVNETDDDDSTSDYLVPISAI